MELVWAAWTVAGLDAREALDGPYSLAYLYQLRTFAWHLNGIATVPVYRRR